MKFTTVLMVVMLTGIMGIHAPRAETIGDLLGVFGGLIQQDMQRSRTRQLDRQRAQARQIEQSIFAKRLQLALRSLQFYDGVVDGQAGSGTRTALLNYYQHIGSSPPNQFSENELLRIEAAADEYLKTASQRPVEQAVEVEESEEQSITTQILTSLSPIATTDAKLNLRLSEEMVWIVIASRNNPGEALAFAEEYVRYFDSICVSRSGNGNFAISIGWMQKQRAREYVNEMISQGRLPNDTFLSSGEKFGAPAWSLEKSPLPTSNAVLRNTLLKYNASEFKDSESNSHITLEKEFQYISISSADSEKPVGLRKQPDANVKPTYILTKGTLLKKLSSKDDWAEVQAVSGRSGWLPIKFLEKNDNRNAGQEVNATLADSVGAGTDGVDIIQLDKIRSDARRLIEYVDGFLKAKPGSYDIASLAQKIAKTQAAISEDSATVLISALAELDREVGKLPGFDLFKKEIEQRKIEAGLAALGDEIKAAKKNAAFLDAYIRAYLTATNMPEMAQLLKATSEELNKNPPSLSSLTSINKNVDTLVLRDKLQEFYIQSTSQYVDAKLSTDASLNQTIPHELNSGLAKEVIEGNTDELLVFFNAMNTAPNITRNLRGDFIFKDGNARSCFLVQPDNQNIESIATVIIQQKGGKQVFFETQTCPLASIANFDLVLTMRGDVLKLPSSQSIPFLTDLNKGAFGIFAKIPKAELKDIESSTVEKNKNTENEIISAVRSGFGIIAHPDNANLICIVVANDFEVHKNAALQNISYFMPETSVEPLVKQMNVDDAFVGFKKHECSAIYGEAKTLAALILASRRDNVPYQIASVWFSEAALAALSTKLETEKIRDAKADAAKRVALQDEQKLAALREAEEASTRVSVEAALQAESGAFARAKSDLLQDQISKMMAGSATWARQSYPLLTQWYAEQNLDGWELISVSASVRDYGTSVWKARALETIFSDIVVVMKNKTLGENRSYCYSLSVIFDGEFDMVREPTEASCDVAAGVQDAWKRGNEFTSQWLATAH